MKKFLFILLIGFSLGIQGQSARVQVVHNCADDMAAVVDVYINGLLAGPDVAFRTSSPFADVPTAVPVNVAIAPGDSTSVLDAFYQETINLEAGETYIIIANGIISPTGYNPSPPFSLDTFDMGREVSVDPMMVDVLVHHGSTDAPTVDAFETGQGLGQVVDNISYTEYQGYLEFPSADLIIELRDASGTMPIAAYEAPLETLGLQGLAATVVASGFFDPTQNSNGPAFGLFAVPPIGGPLIPLPEIPLSIEENSLRDIYVYPNPGIEILHIKSSIQSDFDFEVTDGLGRIVLSGTQTYTNSGIDISGLPAGMYLLKISDASGTNGTTKFIKSSR